MRWNGRGEVVCPLRGQSLESRLAAQRSVVARMPPAPAGILEALSRYAQARRLGISPIVGVLGGTTGRAFVFMPKPSQAGGGAGQ